MKTVQFENIAALKAELKLLERKQAAIDAIQAKIDQLEIRKQAVISGEVALPGRPPKGESSPQTTRTRELPRGLLTMALVEAFGNSKKPLSVAEIIERASNRAECKSIPNLKARLTNILNVSERFERTGRGEFRVRQEAKAVFKQQHNELLDRLHGHTNGTAVAA